MLTRIGYTTSDEPDTVVSQTYDTEERETWAHVVKLLTDAKVVRVWARHGAGEVVYLKGVSKSVEKLKAKSGR